MQWALETLEDAVIKGLVGIYRKDLSDQCEQNITRVIEPLRSLVAQ